MSCNKYTSKAFISGALEEGHAEASSYYLHPAMPAEAFVPANAFDDTNEIWASDRSGFPHYIWMRYPHTHVLEKITVTVRQNNQGPKSFDVVDSMNGVDWTILLSVDMAFPNNDSVSTKSWFVPTRHSFSCLGLKAKSTYGGRQFVDIKRIRMFQRL